MAELTYLANLGFIDASSLDHIHKIVPFLNLQQR